MHVYVRKYNSTQFDYEISISYYRLANARNLNDLYNYSQILNCDFIRTCEVNATLIV